METALVGLIGVLVGILLNEYLRRQRRIEHYAAAVFNKRVDVYHELLKKVHACGEIATEMLENQQYSDRERHDMISATIFPIIGFCKRLCPLEPAVRRRWAFP